jgi:hypothetical protein
MPILLNGTDQWAHNADVPDMSLSWCMVAWARRDDTTTDENIIGGLGTGPFAQRQIVVGQTNRVRCNHGGTTSFAGLWGNTGEWAFVFMSYDSGTLRVRSALDGDADWSVDIGELTGLSDLTPTDFVVGNARADLAASAYLGPIAFMKVWEGRVLTDEEAWDEREYRLPVSSTGIWAAWKFDDGELAVDSSGNDRTLTLVGSPTYTADEPTDILGDGGSIAVEKNTILFSGLS